MPRFRDLPIKHKLNAIILATCGMVLLLMAIFSIIYATYAYRREIVHNVSTLAEVISTNSTAALVFQDPETAGEILAALRAEPYIKAACIFTNNGKLFASYRDFDISEQGINLSEVLASGHRFSGEFLELVRPITLNDKQIGTFYIRTDLELLYNNLKGYAVILFCVGSVSFFIAYIMSSRLQQIISMPILTLSQIMKTISSQKDFSVRAEKKNNDELGALFDGFNKMLKQIQVRDKKLSKAVKKFQVAKNIAEAANIAKSRFLANMSHELRTPLNHIIGFTELVVDQNFGDLNDIQQEYLNDVLYSGKHLLELINDILDLSKVEAGKLELESSDVNPKLLLENSLIMIKEKAMQHSIQLVADIKEIPEKISADERKLKQILYNLLSNAMKFTSDGGSICLAARQVQSSDPQAFGSEQHAAKDFIEIAVQDTGIGLDQEDFKRIFDPFEQLDNSASRKYEGTGLGLALTKQFVELHGGRIWVESNGKDKGSRFNFVIPAF